MTWFVLLLLVPQTTLAATLWLSWDYDRTIPVDRFLLSYAGTGIDGVHELAVSPSSPGTCSPDASETTFCMPAPACPPDGVMFFAVLAERQGQRSEESNTLTCVFHPAKPCACLTAEAAATIDTTTLTPAPPAAPIAALPEPAPPVSPAPEIAVPAPSPLPSSPVSPDPTRPAPPQPPREPPLTLLPTSPPTAPPSVPPREPSPPKNPAAPPQPPVLTLAPTARPPVQAVPPLPGVPQNPQAPQQPLYTEGLPGRLADPFTTLVQDYQVTVQKIQEETETALKRFHRGSGRQATQTLTQIRAAAQQRLRDARAQARQTWVRLYREWQQNLQEQESPIPQKQP